MLSSESSLERESKEVTELLELYDPAVAWRSILGAFDWILRFWASIAWERLLREEIDGRGIRAGNDDSAG